jgi:hypothetical protein
MSSGWSEQAVAALRELVRNPDLSYEQIGRDPRINMSRGAVCGKIGRLGLGRKSNASTIRNRARIKAAQVGRIARAPTLPQTGDFKRIMARHEAEAATRSLVALVDLGDADCRFVIGDPKVRSAVYCGQPAVPGLSYCAACVPRVYEVVEVQHVAPGREREKSRHVRDAVNA